MDSNAEPLAVDIYSIVSAILQLEPIPSEQISEVGLLGSMPELDSMSVVAILVALENEYDIQVNDDEVDASVFTSIATLTDFVRQKIV